MRLFDWALVGGGLAFDVVCWILAVRYYRRHR